MADFEDYCCSLRACVANSSCVAVQDWFVFYFLANTHTHGDTHSGSVGVFCACTAGSLVGNDIGDAGAEALAAAVQNENCSLKELG